jgi:ABC transporter substrate binding protein (PQQ-dependent alcohol dehydrogenase system)
MTFRPSRRYLTFSGLLLVGAAVVFSIGASTPGLAQAPAPAGAAPLTVKVGFLRQQHSKDTISILDIPAPDDGFAGAKLAAQDDNTTGKFLNQKYSVEDVALKPGQDVKAALEKLVSHGVTLVLADLSATDLLKVADAEHGKDVLIFNLTATDNSLRQQDCRRNIIHIAPSRAMLADGLAQYLIWKKWPRWYLIKGSHPADALFAQALEHSAKKFGATIVGQKTYVDTGGGRRSDTGLVQTQKLMPLVTQSLPEFDILIAADESQVFGEYLPYRTWNPRLVAGSAGLVPTSWTPAMDQWGAQQLQNRFMALAHREMGKRDYNAWVAMRIIGDTVSRVNSNDPKKIHDYILSPQFKLGAFKGVALTVRPWNQQLRQPILLSDGRTIVSASPQEGFLHQTNVLDTLGYDKPETKCHFH